MMKQNVILYYVLIMLIVTGAFASMALNSYGITLMSYAALGMAVLFSYELIIVLPRTTTMSAGEKKTAGVEIACLLAICLLWYLRGIAIEIPFDTSVSALPLLILFGVNGYSMVHAVKATPQKIKVGMLLYFAALYLAWVALYLFQAQRTGGVLLTLLALLCLTGFLVFGGWKGKVTINGEETSALQKTEQFKSKTTLQLVGVILVVAYLSLSAIEILPPLYSGSLPNGYSKVLRRWEPGANGNFSRADAKAFEEAYKKFIQGK